ncbi:GNAT family N-acetyltransferase [Saccharopolyspora pogona]|uniref:GNAT family N-acetyltransferase n=1 Tax=Saccharopolyspora pogona TaxID=333966 RepID=UPI001683F307|nr:GNAT family N-acetyltransferase [Saccharopolyspora pogona]
MGTGQIVRNAVERHRYEISVDGELAGFTEYVDRDGQRVFYHTEIDDRFAGRGLATALISDALSDTRTEGKRIVPVCPFVAKYLRKHDDFADIADPVTGEVLAEIRALHQRQG